MWFELFDSPTDLELVARNKARARTEQRPRPPAVRRRAQLAGQLRRFAGIDN
ncbi:hypothetical protein [Nocardioides sp. 616]|uniref:hypothetical protein n=1 Tax=Nocardioides sp. 616 TaxID=2268090 RepID=UPI0013B3A633|nr:hypothetical protein [Nocardioides sp. 616]